MALALNISKFVLTCAAYCNTEYLILGAFGCGVFGQVPVEVASIFKELLDNEFKGVFKEVFFAIPDEKSRNYEAFKKVIK